MVCVCRWGRIAREERREKNEKVEKQGRGTLKKRNLFYPSAPGNPGHRSAPGGPCVREQLRPGPVVTWFLPSKDIDPVCQTFQVLKRIRNLHLCEIH